jgi:hypothetical protein
MKKLLIITLFISALLSFETSFAQERKALEEKPAPSGGRTPAATQAAPASNAKAQENRATPASPATPASKSGETKSATPAEPAQPAQPAKKELQPAKNVKNGTAQPAPGQSRISVNEGGLPATKSETRKAD